jgi:hypothetical protein
VDRDPHDRLLRYVTVGGADYASGMVTEDHTALYSADATTPRRRCRTRCAASTPAGGCAGAARRRPAHAGTQPPRRGRHATALRQLRAPLPAGERDGDDDGYRGEGR